VLLEEEQQLLSSVSRWLPTSLFAAVFIWACAVGFTRYIFDRPQLDELIADGITTKAKIANLRPQHGRGSTSSVDLTWEAAGKFCRSSQHSISSLAFKDIQKSLVSGVDQIPVRVDPTGACRAVIVADIPYRRRETGPIVMVPFLVIAGMGTAMAALAASRS
jgi:hypothetical protein